MEAAPLPTQASQSHTASWGEDIFQAFETARQDGLESKFRGGNIQKERKVVDVIERQRTLDLQRRLEHIVQQLVTKSTEVCQKQFGRQLEALRAEQKATIEELRWNMKETKAILADLKYKESWQGSYNELSVGLQDGIPKFGSSLEFATKLGIIQEDVDSSKAFNAIDSGAESKLRAISECAEFRDQDTSIDVMAEIAALKDQMAIIMDGNQGPQSARIDSLADQSNNFRSSMNNFGQQLRILDIDMTKRIDEVNEKIIAEHRSRCLETGVLREEIARVVGNLTFSHLSTKTPLSDHVASENASITDSSENDRDMAKACNVMQLQDTKSMPGSFGATGEAGDDEALGSPHLDEVMVEFKAEVTKLRSDVLSRLEAAESRVKTLQNSGIRLPDELLALETRVHNVEMHAKETTAALREALEEAPSTAVTIAGPQGEKAPFNAEEVYSNGVSSPGVPRQQSASHKPFSVPRQQSVTRQDSSPEPRVMIACLSAPHKVRACSPGPQTSPSPRREGTASVTLPVGSPRLQVVTRGSSPKLPGPGGEQPLLSAGGDQKMKNSSSQVSMTLSDVPASNTDTFAARPRASYSTVQRNVSTGSAGLCRSSSQEAINFGSGCKPPSARGTVPLKTRATIGNPISRSASAITSSTVLATAVPEFGWTQINPVPEHRANQWHQPRQLQAEGVQRRQSTQT